MSKRAPSSTTIQAKGRDAISSDDEPSLTSSLSSTMRWWSLACLLLGALLATGDRYVTDPDTLSYVNMAEEAVKGNFGELVNGLWSPLYPTLVAVILTIRHVSKELIVPELHFLQWLTFAATTVSFHYFLNEFLSLRATGPHWRTRPTALVVFSYSIFIWATLRLISVSYPTPDMCVAAVIFLAAGLSCKILKTDGSLLQHATLGATLGIGYLAKSAMLPIGLALLATVYLCCRKRSSSSVNMTIALMAMVAVSAPFVTVLSRREGRLTFGDAGRLNYAWHVQHVPFPWIGNDAEDGLPQHPVNILYADPLVLEFAEPVHGTLPIWYDPSYWHEGLRTRVRPRELLLGSIHRFSEFGRRIIEMIPLLAGFSVLMISARSRIRILQDANRSISALAVWSFVSCLLFLPFHVEYRYIAALLALLVICSYSLLIDITLDGVTERILQVVAVCMLILVGMLGVRALAKIARHQTPEYLAMATELKKLGVGPGDSLAVAGYPFDAFYAHVLGARITVQLCDSSTFKNVDWTDPIANCRNEQLFYSEALTNGGLRETLKSAHVKAVVARDRPEWLPPREWHTLSATRYSAYMVEQ